MKGTFTAVAATDVITTSAAHLRSVGSRIQFTTTSALPAGLIAGVDYYVLTTPSSTSMTVSATSGGAVVDITTVGTGVHSWQVMGDAYGEVWLTMGIVSSPLNFVHVPLKLIYTANASNGEVFWAGALPNGAAYDASYHLAIHTNASTPRATENLSILINLLGN